MLLAREKEFDRASTLIQSVVRGYLARFSYERILLVRANAATTIQTAVRGRAARVKFQETIRERCEASVLIQSVVRCYLAKSAYRQAVVSRHQAATKLQTAIRGKIARTTYAVMVAERQAQLELAELATVRSAIGTFLTEVTKGVQVELEDRRITAVRSVISGFLADVTKGVLVNVEERRLTAVRSVISGFLADVTNRTIAQVRERKQTKACVLLQSFFRGTRARRMVSSMRQFQCEIRLVAAVTIQKLVRSYLQKKEAENDIAKVAACGVIASAWRQYWSRRLTVVTPAVKVLQRFARHCSNVRKIRFTIIIQSAFRGCVGRRVAKNRLRSIMAIQALYRGRSIRANCVRKLREIRARLQNANKNATAENTVGNRTKSALEVLLSSRQLTVVSKAIKTLGSITRVLPLCCSDAVEENAIPAIYNLILSCNRSKPHLMLVSSCLDILLNVAAYPKTRPAVFEHSDAVDILTEQLQAYRDKTDLFLKIVQLLQFGCHLIGFSHSIASNAKVVRRLKGVHGICNHKFEILEKQLKDSNMPFDPKAHSKKAKSSLNKDKSARRQNSRPCRGEEYSCEFEKVHRSH